MTRSTKFESIEERSEGLIDWGVGGLRDLGFGEGGIERLRERGDIG